MKKFITLIVLISVVGLFTACTSRPTHMKLVIKSTSKLNPNSKGVPSPLMLTFYELESAEKFMSYDYWTLQEKAGKNLNVDLISQAKHIITPEQMHTYEFAFDNRAKFLGIVGKFREVKNELAWKYVINLEKDIYNFHEVKINQFDIERVE